MIMIMRDDNDENNDKLKLIPYLNVTLKFGLRVNYSGTRSAHSVAP